MEKAQGKQENGGHNSFALQGLHAITACPSLTTEQNLSTFLQIAARQGSVTSIF